MLGAVRSQGAADSSFLACIAQADTLTTPLPARGRRCFPQWDLWLSLCTQFSERGQRQKGARAAPHHAPGAGTAPFLMKALEGCGCRTWKSGKRSPPGCVR